MEAREKGEGTTCSKNPRDGGGRGRKASSTAPGWSHRPVPGQCEGSGHPVLLVPFALSYWLVESLKFWCSSSDPGGQPLNLSFEIMDAHLHFTEVSCAWGVTTGGWK